MPIDKETFNLSALARDIERHLDGWKIQPAGDYNDAHERVRFAKEDLTFSIGWSKFASAKDRERLNVQTWSWPEYTYTERGDVRKTQITPSNLYDPRESSPSISVAISRGGEAIAKEITRRFLPEYERIYGRCVEKAQINQIAANASRDGWNEICRILRTYREKADPKHNNYYLSLAGDMHVQVENRSGRAHVEIDATPAQLDAILKALKGTK